MADHDTHDHTGVTGVPSATAPNPTTIELGHASDTTLSRVSAGVVAIEGTNIVKAGAATGSGLTMATSRLLGRTTASSGAIEEISVGSGLTLSAGSLAATASAAGGLLAILYNTTGGNKTTTSATQADIDATNAQITFTAPSTGNVLVQIVAEINLSGGLQNCFLGLRESTTNLVNGTTGTFAMQGVAGAASEELVAWEAYLTGISAGSHTYKAAFAVNGTITMTVRQATASPLVMKVWACP